MLKDLFITLKSSTAFSEDIKKSDFNTKISNGGYLSLNKTNFPILEKSNISSLKATFQKTSGLPSFIQPVTQALKTSIW